MRQHDFDESRWVEDLGTALEALAQNASEDLLRDSNRGRHVVSSDQPRVLGQRAKRNTAVQDAPKALQAKLNCFRTKAMGVLLTHPVIRRALPKSSEGGWRDPVCYGGALAWFSIE